MTPNERCRFFGFVVYKSSILFDCEFKGSVYTVCDGNFIGAVYTVCTTTLLDICCSYSIEWETSTAIFGVDDDVTTSAQQQSQPDINDDGDEDIDNV